MLRAAIVDVADAEPEKVQRFVEAAVAAAHDDDILPLVGRTVAYGAVVDVGKIGFHGEGAGAAAGGHDDGGSLVLFTHGRGDLLDVA